MRGRVALRWVIPAMLRLHRVRFEFWEPVARRARANHIGVVVRFALQMAQISGDAELVADIVESTIDHGTCSTENSSGAPKGGPAGFDPVSAQAPIVLVADAATPPSVPLSDSGGAQPGTQASTRMGIVRAEQWIWVVRVLRHRWLGDAYPSHHRRRWQCRHTWYPFAGYLTDMPDVPDEPRAPRIQRKI